MPPPLLKRSYRDCDSGAREVTRQPRARSSWGQYSASSTGSHVSLSVWDPICGGEHRRSRRTLFIRRSREVGGWLCRESLLLVLNQIAPSVTPRWQVESGSFRLITCHAVMLGRGLDLVACIYNSHSVRRGLHGPSKAQGCVGMMLDKGTP